MVERQKVTVWPRLAKISSNVVGLQFQSKEGLLASPRVSLIPVAVLLDRKLAKKERRHQLGNRVGGGVAKIDFSICGQLTLLL